MTKDEKAAAITAAIAEHLDNVDAVRKANIGDAYVLDVKTALGKALAEKLGRIFDQVPRGNDLVRRFATSGIAAETVATGKPARVSKAGRAASKLERPKKK
ncbi:MAG: hypothetical protein ABIW82_04610 [Dokdonella sp.]